MFLDIPQIDTSCDGFQTFSYPFETSSYSNSFSTATMSDEEDNCCRRSSFASLATSPSSGIFSASASESKSPKTPMTSILEGSELDDQNPKCALRTNYNLALSFADIEAIHNDNDNDNDMLTDVLTDSSFGHEHSFETIPLTEYFRMDDQPFLCGEFSSLTGYNNPSLSRPIFNTETQSQAQIQMENYVPWFNSMTENPPQTISPGTAFQSSLSSSPMFRQQPMTPRKQKSDYSGTLDSSPMSLISPAILPSQRDEIYYDSPKRSIPSANQKKPRVFADRLHKRFYERRRLSSCTNGSRSIAGKSGIDCDVVIIQNEFACSYPGCIDKATLKQKRFKRQEHKKRHERTVHEKSTHGVHKCWVPLCKTQPFTRTDNLKSHLKNTHGKKSANQRNRYVATQDRNSNYYDPDWIGELTQEGFPVL